MSDPNEPDYYRILNVHHQADPEIIAEAYQRLRARHSGTPAAEREIEAAYAVLGDPDRRAAYDARRRAMRQPKPAASITPAPRQTIAPRPIQPPPAEPGSDTQRVEARCSLTGDTFHIVLLRAKGPYERFRVIGFEPLPPPPPRRPAPARSKQSQGFVSRLFGGAKAQPEEPASPGVEQPAGPDPEYLDFSKFDFGAHKCPICDGEAPPAYGRSRRWVMCGRCSRILCMGAADDDPSSLAITCPWCGTALRWGGPTRVGGRVKAAARTPQLPAEPDPPRLPPASDKRLPGR